MAAALRAGAEVNCSAGWAVRRAVRHNQTEVWRLLLSLPNTDLSLANRYGRLQQHVAVWLCGTIPVQHD